MNRQKSRGGDFKISHPMQKNAGRREVHVNYVGPEGSLECLDLSLNPGDRIQALLGNRFLHGEAANQNAVLGSLIRKSEVGVRGDERQAMTALAQRNHEPVS